MWGGHADAALSHFQFPGCHYLPSGACGRGCSSVKTAYGNSMHKPLPSSMEELHKAIEQTFQSRGKIVILSHRSATHSSRGRHEGGFAHCRMILDKCRGL